MTDDIVARLRFQRTNSVLCAEAADEIERLRAEVAWWRDKAVDYAYDDEKCECDRCVEVRSRHESTN